MKVWIDQDLCTGDGLCEEIAPDVFTLLDDGLAYVKEGAKIFAAAKGNPQGAEGMANIPDGQLDAVIESAEECPGRVHLHRALSGRIEHAGVPPGRLCKFKRRRPDTGGAPWRTDPMTWLAVDLERRPSRSTR